MSTVAAQSGDLVTAGLRALFRGLHAGGYIFKGLIAGVQALGNSSLRRRARRRSIVLSLQVQIPGTCSRDKGSQLLLACKWYISVHVPCPASTHHEALCR